MQWSAAEVADGELTVPVDGDVPKRLRRGFGATAALLDSRWDVKLRKSGTVRVRGIAEGEEEAVHHLVESALQQARASLEPDDGSARPDADDDGSGEDTPADDPDARMTRRFRQLGNA